MPNNTDNRDGCEWSVICEFADERPYQIQINFYLTRPGSFRFESDECFSRLREAILECKSL
jgi:hypothetical protein